MKLENTKTLIQQSIESWDTITPIKGNRCCIR